MIFIHTCVIKNYIHVYVPVITYRFTYIMTSKHT